MEFRILGPLEVLEDGRQVDLGGAKQRALLAVLLLHANEVVSSDRLIDALWEEEAPETGRKALQVYVSQLRKAVGRDRLLTKAPGYLLRVEPGELDLERFRELVDSGHLDTALSLWRGPPLSDFAYHRFAQTDITRLEELRLSCLEQRLEGDLAEGRHGSVVGELEALVSENPLRERLRAQLMLALYRSGRQAEALEAFQDGRRALVEELGLEPSRALRELQQAILAQDPALDLEPSDAAPEDRPASVPLPDAPQRKTRTERKTVTAVHVRVSARSAGGERLDPEVLSRVLTRAFGEVTTAIEAHEGTIDAVAGDSVSGIFGLPLVHEDDPLRAARAAEEARSRLAKLALEVEAESTARVEARIGVSTGEVLTGETTGSRLRATGEPLTLAARLAQEAQPQGMLLDEATRRAVESRRDGSRLTSPMVGRERERRRLHDAFEQAVGDRSCQLFTILGAAGVGKSRLVGEFLGELEGRALVARGRCLPYGEGITFWPLLEAVKEVAALDDTGTPEDAHSRLAALIEGENDAVLIAQRVAQAIGLTESTTGVEEGLQAVRDYFAAIAARRPLVVVFDDIHWGEATFLDLVEHVADWSRGAPLLLVCVARPELLDARPGWAGGKLNATTVLLEPLSHEQCTRLISNLVGESELPDEVATRITVAAEGNPLFVEEMLSMLIDDGKLVRDDGRWIATSDLATFPVPATIQALLAARLDRLDVDERDAIERASVEGKLFHEGWVAHLVSETVRSSVPKSLALLVRKELIRPEKPFFAGERAYHFRHLLIRDAAYDSISKEARADLHERHADWLEPRAGDKAVELEEILGYHLEQAFLYRAELGRIDEATRAIGHRAAERLGAAGRRAFARVDAPAAINLISRAIALLPTDDPLRVDLIPNVRAIQGTTDLTWADAILRDAMEAGEPRLAAHARVQQGFLRLFFADSDVGPEELIAVAEDAIAVFDSLAEDLGLARAWRLIAQAQYLARRGQSSSEAAERALGFARRSDDRFEQLEILEWLGIALLLGPTPAPQGELICERLLDEVAGDRMLEIPVIGTLAYMVGIQGRGNEADELIARVRKATTELGETIWLPSVLLAFYLSWINDSVTAERELRPVYEGLKRIGEKSHFCSIATILAQAVYAQGRFDEAEELAREAERTARPNDVHSHIVWRGTCAKVLARQGELEEAEALAREAVSRAEESDFLHSHGDALSDLAEVLALAGRAGEAVAVVEQAIDLYGRKGNVLAVARSHSLLEELRQVAESERSRRT
jgi:DNA-binding SARP family transcriptional activator/tetratricopeptide (TPR) repeat protein